MRDRDKKRRDECLTALGGVCVKCKDRDLNNLTIDHVDNDGWNDFGEGEHTYKYRLSGSNLYSFLKAKNYRTSRRYQVLCRPCHASKGNWYKSVRKKKG